MSSEFISFALAAAIHTTTVTPEKLFYQSPEVVNLITTSAATCDSIEGGQPPLVIKTNEGSNITLDCNSRSKFGEAEINKKIVTSEEELNNVTDAFCSSMESRKFFEFRYQQMNGRHILIRVNCSKTERN
jgi:hypothetical protein